MTNINMAVFTTIAKKAVTGVHIPSYTSGVQMWHGKAPSLKKKLKLKHKMTNITSYEFKISGLVKKKNFTEKKSNELVTISNKEIP
jgi:hypothetical protein